MIHDEAFKPSGLSVLTDEERRSFHLAAAAPEMFAGLCNAYVTFGFLLDAADTQDAYDLCVRERAKLAALIAAAEGNSPC